MKWFRLEGGESLSEEGQLMKKKRVDGNAGDATLVAAGTSLLGDIRFSGRLYVSGEVTGKVTADAGASATLVIDEGGHIEGDVQAAHVIIAGRIDGNVVASERLEIAATARVRGDMSYRELSVELGGKLYGRVVSLDDEEGEGNVQIFELPGDGEQEA